MKKVCILQNGLARGGTDTFVVNLCRGLDKTKYDITVVNTGARPETRIRERDILDLNVKIFHTAPLESLHLKLKHLWKLYKFLRKEKFDVFQTNIDLFNGPNLMVAWLAGVPVRCCHSHNSRQHLELINGKTPAVRLYQGLMRWMCWTFSNRRCGCSRDAMEFLYPGKNWMKQSQPTIIYNGIDLERFRQAIDVEAKKKELGLTAPHHVITVGHIIAQKNPLYTAEIICGLTKVRKDCDFIWVGAGELQDEVNEILKRGNCLDRVKFFSKRKDIPEIMRCADVFILPSSFEGLGIVAIEAQASGLYALLSDKVPQEADCGSAEFISIDSAPSEWVDKISAILDGTQGRSSVGPELNKFSIEYMTSQMSEVFDK